MGKLIELVTGKRSATDIQKNINWIDNQIKNLEQTKFILEQQIRQLSEQKEKLIQKQKQ